jgi:hypothetical protein
MCRDGRGGFVIFAINDTDYTLNENQVRAFKASEPKVYYTDCGKYDFLIYEGLRDLAAAPFGNCHSFL